MGSPRFDGTLTSWNDERGFGFIEPARGGQQLFAHVTAFPAGTARPSAGRRLSFEVETAPGGTKRARSVQYPPRLRAGRRARPRRPAAWSAARMLAIPLLAVVYGVVVWRWGFSPAVPLAYGLSSALAFLAYALDKSAADAGRWRTSERTLHLLGLAGGWPGALLAQQALRHKTAKPGFAVVFWATVVLNLAGLVAWHAAGRPGLA